LISVSESDAFLKNGVDPSGIVLRAFEGGLIGRRHAVGNLKEVYDGNNNKTSFFYDGLDRVVQELDPRGKWKFFFYDAVGNMIQSIDRLGRYSYFAYDKMDRLKGESWGGTTGTISQNFFWIYDAAGRLSIAHEGPPTGSMTFYSYAYDNLDRNTVQSHFIFGIGYSAISTQTWDIHSRRDAVTYTVTTSGLSTNIDFTNDYVYDAVHRVDAISQFAATAQAVVQPKLVDYEYNLAGDRTSLTRYSDLAGTQLAGTTTYAGYDGVGRLTSLTHRDGVNAVIATYNMSYDRGHRLISGSHVNRFVSQNQTYTYDTAGQITSLVRTGGGGGNRIATSGTAYTNTTNNRIISDGVYNYYYDDEGNLIRRIALVAGSRPAGPATSSGTSATGWWE
jgi:YD repeat-containing protein